MTNSYNQSYFTADTHLCVDIALNPDKLYILPYEPAPFKIEVPENAAVGKYEIPILANLSTVESNFPTIHGTNYVSPTKSILLRIVNLTMIAAQQLTFTEW